MEAKYRIGKKVNINHNNEILEVQVFGHLDITGKLMYSVRQGNKFFLVEESNIIEKSNE
jgi:hypothetical protein